MKEKNKSIQLIRIIAMLMIIVDHLVYRINMPGQGAIIQISNSGTLIFLFISGLLFGRQEIDNWGKWFKKRIFRICIPMWIFITIDMIVVYFIYGSFSIKYVFGYLFNVQGFVGGVPGAYHLWFLTLIMICYIITPLLNLLDRKIKNKKILLCILFVFVAMHIALSYCSDLRMTGNHMLGWCCLAILIYCLGYFYGDKIINVVSRTRVVVIETIVVALVVFIILFFRRILDGTVLYQEIIFWYGIVIVDLWIVSLLCCLGNKITTSKIIDYFDKISYYIYIVHGLAILLVDLYIAKVLTAPQYVAINILVTIVFANLLFFVSSLVYKYCLNGKKND